MYIMKVGKKTYPVADFATASQLTNAARDRSGVGANRFTNPLLFDKTGKQVAYVSYNGRVWAGAPRDWAPDRQPLFG